MPTIAMAPRSSRGLAPASGRHRIHRPHPADRFPAGPRDAGTAGRPSENRKGASVKDSARRRQRAPRTARRPPPSRDQTTRMAHARRCRPNGASRVRRFGESASLQERLPRARPARARPAWLTDAPRQRAEPSAPPRSARRARSGRARPGAAACRWRSSGGCRS